jgi:hypothetical protein
MVQRLSRSRLFNELAGATSKESAEELLDLLAPLRGNDVLTLDDLERILDLLSSAHQRTMDHLRRLRDETSRVVSDHQRQLADLRREATELRLAVRSRSWHC